MRGKREKEASDNSSEIRITRKSNTMAPINKAADMSQIADLIKNTMREELKVQTQNYKSLNDTILALLVKFETLSEQIKVEREYFAQEKKVLVDRIESLEKKLISQERNERRRNVVVRGMIKELKGKEVDNSALENFMDKEMNVKAKIREIVRIIPDKDLVIIELDSWADKKKIMDNKKILKNSAKFQKVFFDHDRSYDERTKWTLTRRHVKELRDSGRTVSAVNGKWIVDGVPHVWCETKNSLVPATSEKKDV